MSKKMKRVAFESVPHVSYEDARARFKHQTLLQDYLELQQETEAARSKLEAMKQKKLTLQAEVRFLRRRHKFLLRNKLSTPQDQVIVKPQYVEKTELMKIKKEKVHPKREAISRNLPPIYHLNQKGRVYTEKKNALPSIPMPVFDLNHKDALHGAKEQSLHRVSQASNLNQRVRTNGVKEILRNNPSPVLDLNQKESTFSSKETVVQSRAPIFDLNQISMEEEELQESCEPFEEQRRGLVRSGIDEQHNDLKLSICRNVGDASTSRSGKRKISWQDPVALRV